MTSYSKLDLGTIDAIVNKLGGMEGVKNFLSGRTGIVNLKPWMTIEINGETINLVIVKAEDLCARYAGQIYDNAEELGLDVCPDETASVIYRTCDCLAENLDTASWLTITGNRSYDKGLRILKDWNRNGEIALKTYDINPDQKLKGWEKFVFMLR